MTKLYGLNITQLFTEDKIVPSQAKHPGNVSDILEQNVVPIVCALESKEAYFVIEPFFQHSLYDVVTFSPAVLSQSNVRTLFIIYQVLQALNWYHKHGIAHNVIAPRHVKVHRGLWVYLQRAELSVPQLLLASSKSHTGLLEDSTGDSCTGTAAAQLSDNEKELSSLVKLWVQGQVSNFDYLTALNRFAGRRLGDPNYHPVFPWVTDFTDPNGGYRDMRKSKFRLNKGDRQLDMTYKTAYHESQDLSGMTSVPHHVSDVLSDITYHVYLARRTSKAVLCEHVRSQWVPNEYPSSMERLYQWTPDECIPQYFSDPTIFTSIHTDLPDLELPAWTSTPNEFIHWHRQVLECEAVSNSLHHWIDLTFGHNLSGRAAVKAKNVCFHLVDKHQHVINHGVMQLFTEPHPSKSTSLPRLVPSSKLQPELRMSGAQTGVLQAIDQRSFDSTSQLEDSFVSTDTENFDPDTISGVPHVAAGDASKAVPTVSGEADVNAKKPIALPESYNPLELLQRFEAIQKFRGQFGLPPSDGEESTYKEKVYILIFVRISQPDGSCSENKRLTMLYSNKFL